MQERRRADNLQEILEAARELLMVDGPGGLTLGAVAAKVGVSTPALYHYFDSKKALLQALVLHGVSVEADVLVATAEAWSGPEADIVGGIVRAMHGHYRPSLSQFRLIYLLLQSGPPSDMGVDAELLPKLHPHSKRMFDALEVVLARGKKAGTVAKKVVPRTAVVTAHMASVGMLTMISLAERAGDPLRQGDELLITSLSHMLVSGVRAR